MANRNPPKKKTEAPREGDVAAPEAPPPAAAASKSMTVDEVAAQIKKLENKLDRMIQRSRKKAPVNGGGPSHARNGDAGIVPAAPASLE